MIRFARIAAIALVGISLTACSAVPDRNVAASVGDATLTHDELTDILGSELGRQLLSLPVDASRYSMDAVINVLNTWITVNAIPADALPDDDGIADELAAQYQAPWDEAPQELRDLLVRVNLLNDAVQSGSIAEQDIVDALEAEPPTVSSRLGAWQGPELGVQPLGQ